MALTTKKTDIPVEERRRMLETLVDAWDRGKVDYNYSLLPVPFETQAHMLVHHYNSLVKPEHHLDPDEAQAVLRNPEQGHNLAMDGMHRVYPPTEFLKVGANTDDLSEVQFVIECSHHYREKGVIVSGDANKGDDVRLFRAGDMDNNSFDRATEYLDWTELRELAVKNGYKKSQSADKSKGTGRKGAGNGVAEQALS